MTGTIPRRLLPQQVTVEEPAGYDYGPPVTYRARVSHIRQLVRSSTGSEVVSEATLTLPPDAVVPPDSRITLPGGAVTYAIGYAPHVGARGVHHVTVTCR